MDPALAGSAELRARFANELAVGRSFEHPSLLPFHDGGEERGVPWVSMRWVDGSDLRHLAPLAPRRAARIVAAVAGALNAMHELGLVHRDVKPGNVLVEGTGGGVFLTDFGLAKAISSDPGLTVGGNWLGTADFAAPEQIRGLAVDARTDVYALGGVLFWALTGRVPYPEDSDEAKMRAHLSEPPPSLDGPLGAVVARAMAKDPGERFASAGELGRAALAAAG
ncbi:MAG: hypothetical protein QOD53_1862 [Thermoleophilaceae bacterium]|nr:hypothetical protein [Thermoleophilaceae bacterium]